MSYRCDPAKQRQQKQQKQQQAEEIRLKVVSVVYFLVEGIRYFFMVHTTHDPEGHEFAPPGGSFDMRSDEVLKMGPVAMRTQTKCEAMRELREETGLPYSVTHPDDAGLMKVIASYSSYYEAGYTPGDKHERARAVHRCAGDLRSLPESYVCPRDGRTMWQRRRVYRNNVTVVVYDATGPLARAAAAGLDSRRDRDSDGEYVPVLVDGRPMSEVDGPQRLLDVARMIRLVAPDAEISRVHLMSEGFLRKALAGASEYHLWAPYLCLNLGGLIISAPWAARGAEGTDQDEDTDEDDVKGRKDQHNSSRSKCRW